MRCSTNRLSAENRETCWTEVLRADRSWSSRRLVLFLLLAALSLAPLASAAEAGYMAKVDFGAAHAAKATAEQLLTHVQPLGGRTMATTIGGLNCQRSLEAGVDDSMYFQVADSYARDGSRSDVYLTVHYFDTGSGTLHLEYDGASSDHQVAMSSATLELEGKAVVDAAVLTDSGRWKAKTFHLKDAYFGNRQELGADFRIVRSGDGLLYVNMAYVRVFCNGRADCTRMVPSPFAGGAGVQIRSLFENPSQWTTARSRLDVIGTYDGNGGFGGATNQELQSWMSQLDQWDLMLSMETGALAEWSCDGEHVFNVLRPWWDRVIQNGGQVDILAIDEPLRKAMLASCWGTGVNANYWPTIKQVVRWYQLVRQNYPNTQLYHIMPYRYHSRATIQNWVRDLNDSLAAEGIPIMDAFSLDPDWRVYPGNGNWNEVKQLENYFRGLNIPFSMIYNPSRADFTGSSNNQDFWNDLKKQAADYRAAGGDPDEYDFQSWLQNLPTTVPESQSYTMTDTVNDLVAQYVPGHVAVNNATVVSNTTPASMAPGQTVTVSVEMKNTGNTTWNRNGSLGYKLGGQIDAGQFAATRHWLNVGEMVPPGQSRTFTFNMTAPTTPGLYSVGWQMVEELVEWFGDFAIKVVTVTTPPATVSVRFRGSDIENGLQRKIPEAGNAQTVATTIGGRTCRRNKDANDRHFFMLVDDAWAFQGSKQDVFVEIEYYDQGTDGIRLVYDGTNGNRSAGVVNLTNTNTWKTYTWHLTDAYFGNRSGTGYDFRLTNKTAGNTFYLYRVEIRE